MEADAPADFPTDEHNELARAVALLERVSGASVEEARRMRRARAEGSVEEIVESARDRAARILSAVGPSVDRATESEVPATEEAFSDFSKELIRVRESVGAARDSVVEVLVLPGAGPKASTPIDLRPAPSFPAEPPARAPRDEPVSAAAAYFAALRTSRYEIPWFLNPPPRPTATAAAIETGVTEITPIEPGVVEPGPTAADQSGDLLPSAKTTTPNAAPAPIVPPPVVTPRVDAPAPAPAPTPVELMPAAKAGSRLRIRRILARLFRDVGILLIAFAVLQLWGTGLLQSHSQHQLRADFAQAAASAHAQRARAAALVVAGKHTTVRQVIPRAPSTGDPVARIRIPAIGVDQVVVEGTGVSELRRGPGHDESTPLPGGVGDSVITGHRTTYGAPFNHLDDLKVGDRISVTTTEGSATYEVSDGPKSVSGGVVAPVAGTDALILTTSQPRYKASGQLAVVARLRNPAARAASTVADRGGSATVGSFGWFASSLWGSVLLWGALLLVVYLAMYRLATRWRSSRIVIFTLMTVPLVITALLFLQAVGRVFPADY
jgi:sortase A